MTDEERFKKIVSESRYSNVEMAATLLLYIGIMSAFGVLYQFINFFRTGHIHGYYTLVAAAMCFVGYSYCRMKCKSILAEHGLENYDPNKKTNDEKEENNN